jgi:hypothetical protein
MFLWPVTTLVDRPVPKAKILGNSTVPARLKKALTDQIQELRWHAKLAPVSLNLPASPGVPEIEVFRIALKGESIDTDLLDLFDKTIAQPILFSLHRPDGQIAHSAAFKRPSEADSAEWVISTRRTTVFHAPPAAYPPLPAAIDLGRLYAALLTPLMPVPIGPGETLAAWADRCTAYDSLLRRVDQAAARVRREKQFNRRVELNRELNSLKTKLEALQKRSSSLS